MADKLEARFPIMGTAAHVTTLGGTRSLLDCAETRLHDLERRWSRFLHDSELSVLNRSAGGPVVVSPVTFGLVSSAIDAWRLTEGRFDPTVGVTMRHAGYDKPYADLNPDRANRQVRHTRTPTPSNIVLYPECSAIQLADGVQLDLGGIAKGAAADLVSAELLAAGAGGCCVNIGGDMRLAGEPPRSQGWRVRLDCPGSNQTLNVNVAQGAICTSTTQKRRWLGVDGPEHHLRDPKTGRSAKSGLRTVTVISATAIQAEVLAKSALLAGQTNGAATLEDAHATGVLVTESGSVVPLPGLEPFRSAVHQAIAA